MDAKACAIKFSCAVSQKADTDGVWLAPLTNAKGLGCGEVQAGAQEDVVLTLVHGTWARDAHWTSGSSPLCQQLQEKTPRLREIFTYSWSGRNSHLARVRAASGLVEHAERVSAKYPSAQHYVIAHSHGGNVALYACENREFRRRIAGIACLSTPFILTRAERFELEGLGEHFVLLGYIVALICIAIITGTLALLHTSGLHLAVRLLAYAGLFVLLKALVGPVFREFHSVWGTLPAPPGVTFFAQPLYKDIEREVNLLIIRSSGDEASAALAAMRFANWLMSKLSSALLPIALLPTRILHVLLKIRNERFAFAMLIGLDIIALMGAVVWGGLSAILLRSLSMPDPLLYLSRSHFLNSLMTYSWVSLLAWPVLLYTAPILAAGVVAVLLAVITSLCRIPFGFYSGLELLGDQLCVEAAPPGRWIVHHLREQPWDYGGLAHSEPYSQPEAITLIVEWLSSPRAHGSVRGEEQ